MKSFFTFLRKKNFLREKTRAFIFLSVIITGILSTSAAFATENSSSLTISNLKEGLDFLAPPPFKTIEFVSNEVTITAEYAYTSENASSETKIEEIVVALASEPSTKSSEVTPTLTPTQSPTLKPTVPITPSPTLSSQAQTQPSLVVITPTSTQVLPTPTEVLVTITPQPVVGDDIWDKIAACESTGNWNIDTGNGYFGGLQFSQGAWESVGGSGNPAHASREEQIERGKKLQAMRGWGVWGACAVKLGLN